MRQFISTLLITLALAMPARADEAAIRDVINGQIEAFKADDFSAAFDFASPTIQSIFQTPETFGTMVRQGYPMVWRPADVTFLGLDMIEGELWQGVLIRDLEGRAHVLEYQMQNGENGWKINAVRFRKEPAGTA